MKTKIQAILICAGLLITSLSFAQNTQNPTISQQQQGQTVVSDAELSKFAKAYQRIRAADQEAQREMIAVVEEHDLDVATFNEIHQAKMENKDVNASEEDQNKHRIIVAEIEAMQPGIQANMEEIVTNQGLTPERYQEISTALQKDPELQEKLEQILRG